MIVNRVSVGGQAALSVSLHDDDRIILAAGLTVSAMIHLSMAEAAQLRDALSSMLHEATPADVATVTVTLSDADEAMERR